MTITKEHLLVRMHVLQLQQISVVMGLSAKIDAALRLQGVQEQQMKELMDLENKISLHATQEQLKDWLPYLKTLVTDDNELQEILKPLYT